MASAGDPLVPHPSLVDFARMDWALRGAFDAAEAPLLQAAALAALAPRGGSGRAAPRYRERRRVR